MSAAGLVARHAADDDRFEVMSVRGRDFAAAVLDRRLGRYAPYSDTASARLGARMLAGGKMRERVLSWVGLDGDDLDFLPVRTQSLPTPGGKDRVTAKHGKCSVLGRRADVCGTHGSRWMPDERTCRWASHAGL